MLGFINEHLMKLWFRIREIYFLLYFPNNEYSCSSQAQTVLNITQKTCSFDTFQPMELEILPSSPEY